MRLPGFPVPIARFRARFHTFAQHSRRYSHQSQRLRHDVAREFHVPSAAAAARKTASAGEQQLLPSAGTAQTVKDEATATATAGATAYGSGAATAAATTTKATIGSVPSGAAAAAIATAAAAIAAAATAVAVAPVPVQPVQRARQSAISRGVGRPQDNAVTGRRCVRWRPVAATAKRSEPRRGRFVPNDSIATSSCRPTGNVAAHIRHVLHGGGESSYLHCT